MQAVADDNHITGFSPFETLFRLWPTRGDSRDLNWMTANKLQKEKRHRLPDNDPRLCTKAR